MPEVTFTRHLRLHFPDLEGMEVAAGTVAEIVAQLEGRYPGIAAYLVDDHGALRKHVNIFINDDLVEDRARLSDRVSGSDRVFVMQALSGG